MTGPDTGVAVAATRTELADLLRTWGVSDPDTRAGLLVGVLRRRQWRYVPEVADLPGPARRARADVQREAMATIREVLAQAKRGER